MEDPMELVKVRKINERNNIKRLYMDFAELAEFGFDVHSGTPGR
jgi:hypothetical protein